MLLLLTTKMLTAGDSDACERRRQAGQPAGGPSWRVEYSCRAVGSAACRANRIRRSLVGEVVSSMWRQRAA